MEYSRALEVKDPALYDLLYRTEFGDQGFCGWFLQVVPQVEVSLHSGLLRYRCEQGSFASDRVRERVDTALRTLWPSDVLAMKPGTTEADFQLDRREDVARFLLSLTSFRDQVIRAKDNLAAFLRNHFTLAELL